MHTNTERAARIGPNAIIRVAEALRARVGEAVCAAVFRRAGLDRYLAAPPAAMVCEAEVVALHCSVRAELPTETADAVMREAGVRTAGYLLAYRVPFPARFVLRGLPAGPAARLLLALIARHAWTFAGSAHVEVAVVDRGVARVTFRGSPFTRGVTGAAPTCQFYAGTFEALFRALVHRDARAQEKACAATGASACLLELSW